MNVNDVFTIFGSIDQNYEDTRNILQDAHRIALTSFQFTQSYHVIGAQWQESGLASPGLTASGSLMACVQLRCDFVLSRDWGVFEQWHGTLWSPQIVLAGRLCGSRNGMA